MKLQELPPRSLDYILAANTYSAFILLKLGQLQSSLEMVVKAEEVMNLLVGYALLKRDHPKVAAYKARFETIEHLYGPYFIDVFDHANRKVGRMASEEGRRLRI